MERSSASITLLGIAFILLAGCGNGGAARVEKTPLLPAGSEIELIRVSEAVWAREAAAGVKDLSPAERTFLCVWNLEAEVNNGGFEQFYLNSAGDNAVDTPAALQQIGAAQAAAIASEANNVFGPSGPPAGREARARALERLGAPAKDALNALDSRFQGYPDNLEELLKAFVERNREQFYAPQ